MNKTSFMKMVLAVLLGLSVYNEALSQKNPNLKGQNRLLKGVEQYRLIVKFSQDEIVDIDNNKPLARTASKQRLGNESLVNKHSFRQVFTYSQSDRKAMRGPDKPTVAKGKFNHFAFRGLVYVNGAEKLDKNALLQLANDFEKLPSVEYASLESVTPIAPPSTPDLTSYQHYKYDQYTGQANVYGIDAEYAWSIGITGQGVKIADIEWGFNYQHEDLTGPNFIELAATTNHDSDDHGTAVAGILYAKNNGLGTTGMVYGADKYYGVSEFYNGRVGGIALGVQSLSAGDVFLYEMQAGGINGYVPADYDQAVWDITKTATDAGIIVVAAAGNGSENLDDPAYASYRARGDNGSILVGAGTKVGRDRASFSTYGSSIHLQGWGDWTVASTGYGDLFNGGPNATYTNSFSGTSSATPIVASAVVAVQSYAKNVKGTTLTPQQMRALLISTGTPQGAGGHIGPLPNIRRAIESLAAGNTVCSAPAWNATTTYLGDASKGAGLGEVVSYSGKQYRAKWWTQNNTPGTSDVWLDLGACGTPNTPPTVSITTPTNNAVYNDIPATIDIVVEAGDREGIVSKVEFFNGATKLGEDLLYPYTFSWTNVAVGTYVITAKATDNNGATTTSAAANVVVAPPSNYAPIVTLTSPTANSKYIVGSSITVSANVSDPDNDAISKVEIWSPQLGTASTVTLTAPPYTATYTQLPAIDPKIGGLTFVVKAYDARGATGYQDIFVSQDKLPQVYISSPSNSSTVPAGNTTISAEASDDIAVTRVDFVNAIGTVVYSDNTAPYQYTANFSAGNYTYGAIAYDNVNQRSTTANVSFTVTGTANQTPTAVLTAPANGSVIQAGSPVTLTATANDVDGTIAKVEFYSNTLGKLGEDATAPYSLTIANAPQGNFLYFAKAIDNNGAEGYSTPVAITSNVAPVVTITAPLPVNGINPKYLVGGSLTISANVTDADGTISKVEFTKGNTTDVVTVTTAPYTATFTNLPAPAPDGSYYFNVKAYDNNGGTTTTLVIVYKNRVPTVTITSPANNATFTAGSNITINTLPYDPDFVSGKVEFFNGSTKLGEVTSTPFNFTINNVVAGTYNITAKITDDMGESGTSAVTSFTVTGNTCTAAVWNSTTAYSTNAIVSYNGIKYKANYWSQGATPNTHSAAYQEWTNQGTCNSRVEAAAIAVLSVYPNPVSDVLNISVVAEELVRAEIRNLNGELVLAVSNTSEINVSTLAAGLYTISIQTTENSTIQKFVKQ